MDVNKIEITKQEGPHRPTGQVKTWNLSPSQTHVPLDTRGRESGPYLFYFTRGVSVIAAWPRYLALPLYSPEAVQVSWSSAVTVHPLYSPEAGQVSWSFIVATR